MKQLSTFRGEHFVFHVTKNSDRPNNSKIKDYPYDLIISSEYVYAPLSMDELKRLADFIYKTIGGKTMSLIKCFSNVSGYKEANEIVIDLNQMKSDESEGFYIKYDKNQDYSKDDNYLVVGNVTQADWDELNLDMDFMQADVL